MVALVAGGAGLFGAIINGWFNRRKVTADAASTITSASIELVEALRGEVDDLRVDLKTLKTEIERCREQIEAFGVLSTTRESEISQLKARIDAANKIIDAQELRIAHLEAILRKRGIDPFSVLDEDDEIDGVVF